MLYTVYGLHEAGKPNEIQYVGCTEQRPEERLAQHIAARNGTLPVNRWIAKTMSDGKRIKCRTLTQTERVTIAFETERDLIVQFSKCWPLHNVESNPSRRTRAEYALLREENRAARAARMEKIFVEASEAVSIIRAKIADGSLNLQSFLSGQN